MTAPPAGALEACPFCGHVPQDLRDAFHPSGIRWREDRGQRHYIGAKDPRDGTPCWEMNCLEHEGGCGASMSGDGREEVLAKWNRRAHGPALLAALRLREGWIPVSERLPPDGELVEVYAPDTGDGEVLDFDGVEEGSWVEHECRREHFLVVGGTAAAGPDCVCTGPAEEAPYTHWRRIVRPTADDLARVLEESATGDEAGSA